MSLFFCRVAVVSNETVRHLRKAISYFPLLR